MFANHPYTRAFLVATLTSALGITPALAAEGALATAWQGPEMAQSRLILGTVRPRADGTYLAGLELKLEEGWFTYWRTPGETGVAPGFDWDDAENVEDIGVLWPAPVQKTIEGQVVNGYEKSLVLPLIIRPEDAHEPMEIDLTVSYAICRDVCVPVTTEHKLTLMPPDAVIAGQAGAAFTPEEFGRQAEAWGAWGEAFGEWMQEQAAEEAEKASRVAEKQAEEYARLAEEYAERYAAMIETYMEQVPQEAAPGGRNKSTKAEIKEIGDARFVEITLFSDSEFDDPKVIVEGPDRVVFGRSQTTIAGEGKTLLVLAPIARAGRGPLDGKRITVTVIDRGKAYEERIVIVRREELKTPWTIAETPPAPPAAPLPPPFAIPAPPEVPVAPAKPD